MRTKDLLHKEMIHNFYGRIRVIEVPKGSKANVRIRVIQRGPGWNDAREDYLPIKEVTPNPDAGRGAKSLRWKTTKTDYYGYEELVHKDSLTEEL